MNHLPNPDGCPLIASHNFSVALYDKLAPVRAFLAEHPEFKEEFVKTLGDAATHVFAGDFYGDPKWWSK